MDGSHFAPTRLLMTADTIGGVWTHALDMARGLEPFGVHIALATMGAPVFHHQRAAVERLGNVVLFESGYKLEWMDAPWRDVEAAGGWLLELESRFAPDIVHLNGYSHGALPWRAPVVIGAHSCVLSWWRAVKGEAAPGRYERYRRQVAEGLRRADAVAAPSRAMLLALYENYGPFSHGRVLHNGRDSSGFVPGPKMRFIMAAGRLWDAAKNIALLDNVAPRIDWPIYVAGEEKHPHGGDGSFRNVSALGVTAPDELARWLAQAAIYALPARYEPFGLSALEAGLCGCALVLGDIPSLREVWGDAALFVAPDDADGLCATLGLLISNRRMREEMASRARRRAVEFSHHAMARGYLSLYSELLEPSEVSP